MSTQRSRCVAASVLAVEQAAKTSMPAARAGVVEPVAMIKGPPNRVCQLFLPLPPFETVYELSFTYTSEMSEEGIPRRSHTRSATRAEGSYDGRTRCRRARVGGLPDVAGHVDDQIGLLERIHAQAAGRAELHERLVRGRTPTSLIVRHRRVRARI